MTYDQKLLLSCVIIQAKKAATQEQYRIHCCNALAQIPDEVTDLRLAGNPPHREFDC